MTQKVFARTVDHELSFCCGVGEPGGWSFVEKPDSWTLNSALEKMNSRVLVYSWLHLLRLDLVKRR